MAAKNVTSRKAGKIEYTLVRGGVKNFNLRVAPDGRVRLEFDAPQRAITPGQTAALYDGDAVLGGGIIASAE